MSQQHPSVIAFNQQQAQQRRRAGRRRLIVVASLALLAVGLAATAILLPTALAAGAATASVPGSVAPSAVGAAGSASVAPSPAPASASAALPPDTPFYEADPPLLFNANNPIPDDYAPELVTFESGGLSATLAAPVADAYQAMAAAAEEAGVRLRPVSTWRTHQHQTDLYNAGVAQYTAQGYARQEAERLAGRYYALPGTSEHEAGLAVDIGDADATYTDIQDSFEQTAAFLWLWNNAADYGFILRYPGDAEEITGIAYEPWHYRYVGSNHAGRIRAQYLTLEEYMALFEAPASP